jgi:uncharacterized protein YfdQ (DUF2303 family)
MDSTAIDRIAQLAVEAEKANRLDTHTPSIVVRHDDGAQRVISLEDLQAHRSRFRGTFATSSLQDFARYVVAHVGGAGFIRPDSLAATVIFNLQVADDGTPVPAGAPAIAGHADHRAELTLKASPAYAALHAATTRQPFQQKPLVEWLEDWWDCLAADYPNDWWDCLAADYPNDTGEVPGPTSDPLFMRQAMTAIRKVKIKANSEAVHTEKDFGATRSALEDVEASSDVGLPRGFRFTCQPSDDLDSRAFYLRLGVLTGEDKPKFVLRWVKRESDIEAVGQNFKAKLLNAIGDKATMLLGTFDPGK